MIGKNYLIIENFNDESIETVFSMNGMKEIESLLTLPVDGKAEVTMEGDKLNISMSPRSMVVIRID